MTRAAAAAGRGAPARDPRVDEAGIHAAESRHRVGEGEERSAGSPAGVQLIQQLPVLAIQHGLEPRAAYETRSRSIKSVADALVVGGNGFGYRRSGFACLKEPAGDLLPGADLSPHVLRHSQAMHLYDAGVPLPYIRDLLGHAELATTDIYARASTEAKRKALEAAYTDVVVTDDLPEWNQDAGLLNWLASL